MPKDKEWVSGILTLLGFGELSASRGPAENNFRP